MYTLATFIFILFTLSVGSATVSVDTIDLGVHIGNLNLKHKFTLSVASATVIYSVDTIGVHFGSHHFQLFTLIDLEMIVDPPPPGGILATMIS